MEQKLPIKLTALVVLCLFSSSCRSMLNYSDNSSAVDNYPDAIIAGHFVNEKKHNEGDIVISGHLTHSVWSSFLLITGLRYQWKGTLFFSSVEQPLSVVTWLVDYDNPSRCLSPVSIRGLPASFNCKDFNVLSYAPSFSKWETRNRLTEFTLNSKIFRVEFYPQYRFQNMENHFELFQSKKQKIQIVDESGKIYADFDMNSYRIYEQPPSVSIEQLQMAISAFSVVQHICFKLRGSSIAL